MQMVTASAKVTRPRLAAVYQRQRLFDALDAARRRTVTVVSGPPGAGKTTLVSSYIELRNLRCLWYQVDRGDEDPGTFFQYFDRAAQQLRSRNAASVPQFNPEFLLGLARFACHYFRNLYASLSAPFVVVLDDYHEASDQSGLHEIVRSACEELPDGCQLILVNREGCPPLLARMRANRGLAIIGPDELSLTSEETEGIAELHGHTLCAGLLRRLHARVAGWAAGLMLLLDQKKESGAMVAAVDTSHDAIFDYFASEVLKGIPATAQDLLFQCALLPKMTAPSVTALTGAGKAAELLRSLARRNYFITRHDGKHPVYQFHPLFRQFLLGKATGRYTQSNLDNLKHRAATVLVAEDDAEAAFELLRETSDWASVAAIIIIERAPALMAQTRLATLRGWIEALPETVVQEQPWLLYWLAVCKALADPRASQTLFESAYRRFSVFDDLRGLALSWCGLMDAIFHVYADLRQFDTWIAEFEARLAQQMPALPAEIATRVTLSLFVALSFRQPQHPDSGKWAQQACDIIESKQDFGLGKLLWLHLTMHDIWRGELATAGVKLGMFRDALPTIDEAPMALVVGYLCEATYALHAGLHDQCLAAVANGLEAARRTGIVFWNSVLLGHGAAISINYGNIKRADEFLSAIAELERKSGPVDRHYYLAVAAWRHHSANQPEVAAIGAAGSERRR
jgi:LuxR family transcriptional regulator, maltose regulon positive regulatory protein